MPRRGLTPDVALDVLLSAICSRHKFDRDPAQCLAELRVAARGREGELARVAGEWVGYYLDDYTARLSQGLLTIPGALEHILTGVQQRGRPVHGAPERVNRAQPTLNGAVPLPR